MEPLAKAFTEVRDHSTVAAPWMASTLLSGITEQVNINKQIPFILARFVSRGFCVMFGAEDLIAENNDRQSCGAPVLLHSALPWLLTNAVGLQGAELVSRIAVAGVAGLHRNAPPVAANGRSGGALVDTYGEMCALVIQAAGRNAFDSVLRNIKL